MSTYMTQLMLPAVARLHVLLSAIRSKQASFLCAPAFSSFDLGLLQTQQVRSSLTVSNFTNLCFSSTKPAATERAVQTELSANFSDAVVNMTIQDSAPGVAYDMQWIEHWKKGVAPGQLWDAGKISPMLAKLLQNGDLHVQGKKVLVPGCGRGYDVFAFALAGASPAVGLDLCEQAIAAAAAERDKELHDCPDAASRAEVVADNFFSYVHHSGHPFDIGYDYTFLCALHPDMRKAWAEGWARVLAPGAELITMIFPVGPGFVGNPPWEVSPELYQELLIPAGFEQVQLKAISAELSHKGRGGREWLGRWRRVENGSKTAAEDASRLGDTASASRL